MINEEKYFRIIKQICDSNDISKEELLEMLQEKDMKYLYILFLKKYDCWNEKELKEVLRVKTRRSIHYNYKKAEEKLLINKKFRDKYFEIEKKIEAEI